MLNRRKQFQGHDSPDSVGDDTVRLLDTAGQIHDMQPGANSNKLADKDNTNSFKPYPSSSGDPRFITQTPIAWKHRDNTLETCYMPSNQFTRHPDFETKPSYSKSQFRHRLDDSNELVNNSNYFRTIDFSEFNKQQAVTDFIYYTVQPGDTLQNLSVKYSCPVALIKRLNNLWSDQEFYGLSKLKLPVGKLRLLEDVISEENLKSGSVDHKTVESSSSPFMYQGKVDQQNNIHIDRSSWTDQTELYDLAPNHNVIEEVNPDNHIFKEFDMNLEKVKLAARSYSNNADAILQSLAQSGNIVADDDGPQNAARQDAETLMYDLSDYGLTYNGLILFIFIVCLIFPLALIIYLEEIHQDSNKHS